MKTSAAVEFLFLLVNRLATPGMVFVAIVFFSRLFEEEDVTLYLLSYTVAQWATTATYQWQKNAYVKTYGDVHERSNTIVFLITTIMMIVIILIFSPVESRSVNFYIAGYSALMGATYLFGIFYRMRGRTRLYLIGDTISTLVKWIVAISVVSMFLSLQEMYLILMCLSIPLVLLYIAGLNNLSVEATSFDIKNDIARILKFSAYMFIFDFCTSGMNYIDRFYVGDEDEAGYLMTSTIGTQLSAVFLGAFISTINPKLKGIKAVCLVTEFRSKLVLFTGIGVLMVPVAYFAGPFVVSLIADYEASPLLISLFTLYQLAHFLIMYIFIHAVLLHSAYYVIFLYSASFLAYVLFLILALPVDPVKLVGAKVILLGFAALATYYIFNRKVDASGS